MKNIKNKAIMIILVFFLALIIAGSASATGNSNTTSAQSTVQKNSSTTSTNNGNLTGPDPDVIRNGVVVYSTTSIQDAINHAQPGDTIRLENEATFYENDLIIPINLTIDVWNPQHDGPGGRAIINSENGIILSIHSGVTVNLCNLTLANSYDYHNIPSNDHKRAIANYGTLNVTGCYFLNNNSPYPNGGAIYNAGTLNVTNCVFSTLESESEGGGAIYNAGTLNVTGSVFSNNSADHEGGAIYGNNIHITSCYFIGNTSYENGGAIYGNNIHITNCQFISNTAYRYGGAIYLRNGSLIVSGSIFNRNQSRSEGGAICAGDPEFLDIEPIQLSIKNSTFKLNTAVISGSAIAIYTVALDNNKNYINGCEFYLNYDQTNGYSISNTDQDLDISNSTFTDGGAIANLGEGELRVNNSTLINSNFYNKEGSFNAEYNWWGTNFTGTDPIKAGRANSLVDADPWIVLTITANPTTIPVNGSSTITADLMHDNHGNPVSGVVPYTGQAHFSTDLGTIQDVNFNNAKATSTLYGGSIAGYAHVIATVDSQKIQSNVIITDTTRPIVTNLNPENGAIKGKSGAQKPYHGQNIPMQSTGAPLALAALALLSIVGGSVYGKLR